MLTETKSTSTPVNWDRLIYSGSDDYRTVCWEPDGLPLLLVYEISGVEFRVFFIGEFNRFNITELLSDETLRAAAENISKHKILSLEMKGL